MLLRMTPSLSSRLHAARIATLEEMADALEIRRAVFIDEQHVPGDEEIDHYDDDPTVVEDAVHVLVHLASHDSEGDTEGEPIATGRLLLDDLPEARAHIGRVAVLAEHRRTGAGRVVMQWLQTEARRRRRPGITLSAQLQAIPFYERLGYTARGEIFLDAAIEHRWMDLDFE
jgi:predicted GNAT family N-acyltransferase